MKSPFSSKKSNRRTCSPFDQASYTRVMLVWPWKDTSWVTRTSRSLCKPLSLTIRSFEAAVEFKTTTTRTASISPSWLLSMVSFRRARRVRPSSAKRSSVANSAPVEIGKRRQVKTRLIATARRGDGPSRTLLTSWRLGQRWQLVEWNEFRDGIACARCVHEIRFLVHHQLFKQCTSST